MLVSQSEAQKRDGGFPCATLGVWGVRLRPDGRGAGLAPPPWEPRSQRTGLSLGAGLVAETHRSRIPPYPL